MDRDILGKVRSWNGEPFRSRYFRTYALQIWFYLTNMNYLKKKHPPRHCCRIFHASGAGYKTADLLTYLCACVLARRGTDSGAIMAYVTWRLFNELQPPRVHTVREWRHQHTRDVTCRQRLRLSWRHRVRHYHSVGAYHRLVHIYSRYRRMESCRNCVVI